MKSLITLLFILFFASAVGWFFMPENWRGKISSAASVALGGNKQEIKKYFKDAVLPQNPEKRRTILLGELKKSLADIKKESVDGLAGKNSIVTAEEIVKELEEVNHDKSFTQEAVERVVNKILPVKNEVIECKPR